MQLLLHKVTVYSYVAIASYIASYSDCFNAAT